MVNELQRKKNSKNWISHLQMQKFEKPNNQKKLGVENSVRGLNFVPPQSQYEKVLFAVGI